MGPLGVRESRGSDAGRNGVIVETVVAAVGSGAGGKGAPPW